VITKDRIYQKTFKPLQTIG